MDLESQSPLREVVVRVAERREQWLVKQGVPVYWGKRLVETKVQGILEHLKELEITSVTEERLKAVWHESEQEAVSEIVALIHQGIDVKSPDEGAALRDAAKNGLISVVSLLLERNADVATHDEYGWTALRYAAYNGHTDLVSFLLEKGTDIAATAEDGKTALHYVARRGHTYLVSLLLEEGADIAATDNDGLTVIHHAVSSSKTEVVELLLKQNADAHALTKEGHNALSHVILVKHDNLDDDYLAVVRLLCSQEPTIKLPPSTQTPPLEKHQLGILACAQYWQSHKQNHPLLEVPSEVVKGGEEAVKTYITDLEKTDARELVYRLKICVVGPSTWGKTSFIKSMAEGVQEDIPIANRTIGIDLFSLKLVEEGGPNRTEVRQHDVTFWDFAGQNVYHVAHAVFFSKRTLYLVCIDLQAYDKMLKDADADVNTMKAVLEPERIKQRFFEKKILRWIVLILFRQPDAQFKLIGTKRDLVSDASRIAAAVKDVKLRLNKFLDGRDGTGKMAADMISSMMKESNVDDQDGTGKIRADAFSSLRKELKQKLVTAGKGSVESTKEAIQDVIFTKTDLSFKMPATYTKVLEHIKNLRSSAATGTQQDQMRKVIMSVSTLCNDLMDIPGLEDANCEAILRVLHDLGDILWYEGSGDSMEELVILDPSVMLDLVRQVVNHNYEDKADERYKALWRDGTLPHSLLVTFSNWKCLTNMDNTGEMVRLFKRLLHHLNLVYPVNDAESIDKADIIVPMYWKAREKAKNALKPLTKQNTILEQNFGSSSYIAKWRYSLPIAISEAAFVNFVVKCYRPHVHHEVQETHFESSVHNEFRAAIYLSANETGHYDDITIEVAAAKEKLAWAEMMYFVIDMEKILEKSYPGLTKHGKLKRSIADDQGDDRDVNFLLKGSVDEEQLRRKKAPWLPLDFSWFIQKAWINPGVFDKLHLRHQLEVLKKLVVTKDKRRLPALWSLAYPKKGEPIEIRVHSDLSGKCWHDEPLKIPITDNFFTEYSQFFQIGLSVLSVVSGTIPISLVKDTVGEVLKKTKSTLTVATTVKTFVGQAHLGPGEEKLSNELDMGPAKREEFLLALLAEHNPPLNERTIVDVCELCRVATKDGQYLWVHKDEFEKLKDHIKCEQEHYVPTNPMTISLCITDAMGSWDARIFTKMYCEWKLSHGIKDPELIGKNVTEKTASTSTGATWGSNDKKLNQDPMKLRNCTLEVWVKQTRRLTGCFRDDKVLANSKKQLRIDVYKYCNDKTIHIPIKVDKARTVNCQITIEFEKRQLV